MGIVIKQSFKNIALTYFGFAIGGINVLFLFTNFLSKGQYGLVSYILSVSNILSPFLSFGVSNSFIKFYSSYKSPEKRAEFTSFMFLLPLLSIFICFFATIVFYNSIYSFISRENPIVGEYIWTIFLTSVFIAYFEVFYSFARANLKTVEGTFLKEVFPRVFSFILLFSIHFDLISFQSFIYLLTASYLLRLLIMFFLSHKMSNISIRLAFPSNYKSILTYTSFLILSSAVSSLFLDIDKFMLNQYLSLENIALYSVSVFIATTISVPYRGFYQIISPMVAKYINEGNRSELEDMCKKGTDLIFLASSFVFILIVVNQSDIYSLISHNYHLGYRVLLLISVVKLIDSLTGMSNAVLFNTSYYRLVLYLGIFLLFCTIGLNIVFIPKFGIDGCALASFISFFIYDCLKIFFVYKMDKIHPFSNRVLFNTIFIFIVIFLQKFIFIDTDNSILDIISNSILISVYFILYILFIYNKDVIKILKY